jgi:hypothetical protein
MAYSCQLSILAAKKGGFVFGLATSGGRGRRSEVGGESLPESECAASSAAPSRGQRRAREGVRIENDETERHDIRVPYAFFARPRAGTARGYWQLSPDARRAEKKRVNSRCPALDLDSFLLYLTMITVPEPEPGNATTRNPAVL